jgi:hypothetical protein
MSAGWISTGPGALIGSYPIHDPRRNQIFTPGRDPFLFSVPLLWDKAETFQKLTRHAPSFVTDLAANLAHYRKRYAKTLENQRSLDDELALLNGTGNENEFRIFHGRFYEYIADELRRTEASLTKVRRLVELGGREEVES